MSKYMINKLLWEVEASEDSLSAFVDDSRGFIDRWERTEPLPPYPSGGTLTSEERIAFESWDYASLYRMGAHPFLLWQFALAVWVPNHMEAHEFVAAYRIGVAEHGHPDFAT
jgi:hypothetical protein